MDIIKKSFKACGISVALDGSENCEINVFKNPDCVIGLEKLEKWRDENDQVVEEDVEEEEKMMVDSDEDSEDEVLLDDE